MFSVIMFKFQFDKKPVVENSQRTSASVFVRHNYLEMIEQMNRMGKPRLDLNNERDVELFVKTIEESIKLNLKQEVNGEVVFTEANSIKLTYTKSNLGKGFVFWFICNICGRKVRYLYIPPNSHILACRACHRLAYRKQNEENYKLWRRMLSH